MNSVFGIGGLLSKQGGGCPTRAQIQAELAAAPPLASLIGPEERACFQANADLLPDDYAALIGEIADATTPGKRTKLVRYGVGLACGAVLGIVIGKYVL